MNTTKKPVLAIIGAALVALVTYVAGHAPGPLIAGIGAGMLLQWLTTTEPAGDDTKEGKA